MKTLKDTLGEIICTLSDVESIFDHKNSTCKGLKNYIARYSLASDQYKISNEAFPLFQKEYGIEDIFTRSRLNKKLFTYEHSVPVSVVMEEIKKNIGDHHKIKEILKLTDVVTIITKEEDERLNKIHKSSMPPQWDMYKHSPLARYTTTTPIITISKNSIKVKGALHR